MNEWWAAMSGLEHVFWYIAVPASLLLIIQTILTFIGADDAETDPDGGGDLPDELDGDFDEGDFDGEPDGDDGSFLGSLKFFTVRNFIAFFTMFGWGGIAMVRSGSGAGASIIVALMLGAGAMVLMAVFFKLMYSLQHSGSFALKDAVGKTGEIYSPVAAEMSGYGKVNVEISGQTRELKAVTKGDALGTGTTVKITGVSNGRLVVERI